MWRKLRGLGYEKQFGRIFVRVSIKKPYIGARFEMDFTRKSCFELDVYFGIWYYVTIYVHFNRSKTYSVQKAINNTPSDIRGGYSDGYHTFNELYEFRKIYNAALFNEWAYNENGNKYDVHKSWKHHDGELCFGGGWFIVVAVLPEGQISNHYEAKDWDLFSIPETEKAKYEFDGHTSRDVINRLKSLLW